MAFKTPGDDCEQKINESQAVEILRRWINGKEALADAKFALQFLQDRVSKIRPFCEDIKKCFALEGAEHEDFKRAVCVKAFNGIVKRINTGR